jgi:integrase
LGGESNGAFGEQEVTGAITKHRKKSDGRLTWGYWFVPGLDASGKRIQVTKSGFATRALAKAALDELMDQHHSTLPPIVSKPPVEKAKPVEEKKTQTVGEYLEYWLRDHAAARCAAKTMERYGDFVRYIVRKLGEKKLTDLTSKLLQEFVNRTKVAGGAITKAYPDGKPLSARTVRHITALLYGALADAERFELIPVNPMAGRKIKLPKRTKAQPKVLDPAKLGQLFAAAKGSRLYPFVVLAASSGCRRGELLALTWDDLDFDSGMMTISKSLEQAKGQPLRVKSTKSGEPRSFEVDDFALAALRDHRQQQDSDRKMFGRAYQRHNLIFCQPNGAYYSPDRCGARVKELMVKEGLSGVSLHSLRHSNASVMLSAGVPLPVVSERLGHADQNITLAVYSHVMPKDGSHAPSWLATSSSRCRR